MYDYERYQAHGILPYSGGYREQPSWVLEDFKMLGLWMELVHLTDKLPKPKPGMKTIAQLTGMTG